MNYRPQLDGLRALAIAGVIYSHFLDKTSPAGSLGVLLFFTLSGYLITGMLLEAKEGGGVSLPHFYMRRALRLWPAYGLALGTAVVFDIEGMRAVAWWHAAYASNILFALREDYVPWVAAAWWSLAVEEQFYLVWPVAMMLASRRALPWVCIAAIAGSLAFTAAVQWLGGSEQMHMLLPGVMDSLAGGALLAVARRYHPDLLRHLSALGLAAAVASLAILALGLQWEFWVRPLLVAAACALVNAASIDSRWGLARVLASRPAIFIGRISYGIYLYHLLVLWALMQLPGFHPVTERGWLTLLVGSLLTVALATLSWFAIERPFNRLKSRFPLMKLRPRKAPGGVNPPAARPRHPR